MDCLRDELGSKVVRKWGILTVVRRETNYTYIFELNGLLFRKVTGILDTNVKNFLFHDFYILYTFFLWFLSYLCHVKVGRDIDNSCNGKHGT